MLNSIKYMQPPKYVVCIFRIKPNQFLAVIIFTANCNTKVLQILQNRTVRFLCHLFAKKLV